jgi:hypothetical protein
MSHRPVAGFAIVPPAIVLVVVTFAIIFGVDVDVPLTLTVVTPIAILLVYLFAIGVGTPVYAFLCRKGLEKLWHYVAAGVVVGLVPALPFSLGSNIPNRLLFVALVCATVIPLGALGGALFWLISVRGSNGKTGA